MAVANEDLGTDSTLVGHLDAGAQTVRKLRTNHQLGWRFVSKSDALNGVESGEYYAAIVLPDDFSATLIGSVTGTTKRPHITYYVNEKENAIAPKITDTGATEIDEQINSTFVTAVADAWPRKSSDPRRPPRNRSTVRKATSSRISTPPSTS